MKTRTKIISPLDTFEGDLCELDENKITELKKIFFSALKLDSFSLQKGTQTIFFPPAIISNSIIVLDILKNNDDNEVEHNKKIIMEQKKRFVKHKEENMTNSEAHIQEANACRQDVEKITKMTDNHGQIRQEIREQIDGLVSVSPDVGDVIRLKTCSGTNTRFRVWKITGIHLGATGHESLVSLKSIDTNYGSAYGSMVTESFIPLELLTSHPGIEKIE